MLMSICSRWIHRTRPNADNGDRPTGLAPRFADSLITLLVGERRFTTNSETLTERSPFFSALLSGRWDNKLQDGSYFVDADGDLFEHILRYLRRGLLPVFYDNVKGHDYNLYMALLQEAKYFGILRLEKWLENKEYLKAVEVHHTVSKQNCNADDLSIIESNVTKEYLSAPLWSTQSYWHCPHDIPEHAKRQRACQDYSLAHDHHNATTGRKVTVVSWDATVLRKETVFNDHLCLDR
ncbi:BTB/POZ protein [Amylocarpus encephaloides]|uniref:BTB/POZ protein n=1 Tax=Amylocarpus encephaloides TaxID=45428 RepID=A0A9P7YKF1_9HELO|nr:BTB/POZ protein [Amylocarpus encephaloides]